MNYSDRDLIVATQIAYYDFSPDIIKANGGNASLRDLLMQDNSVYNKLDNNLKSLQKNGGSQLEISRAQSAIDLYKEIKSNDSPYGNWVIKDIRDDNKKTGFYGCLIETGENSAVVGFRGSEDMKDPIQLEKDWIKADLGLLNSKLTEQQGVATGYMEYINKKYNYDEYATSGHSLGGNLSAHACITAPDEMRKKIKQCLNADGPGFSKEYLSDPEKAKGIKESAGKMKHLQWSFVGALFTAVVGSAYISAKTKDEVYDKYDMDSLTQKHDSSFVEYDEYGNIKNGEMDSFARSVGRLSRELDESPSAVGNSLIWRITKFTSMTDPEKAIAGKALIAGAVAFAITHPIGFAVALVALTAVVVIGKIDPEFYGKVMIPFLCNTASFVADSGQKIVDGITRVVAAALNTAKIAKNIATSIITGVASVISGWVAWASKKLNPGYGYATAHPSIQVDTDKLDAYAARLRAVNNRIRTLDSRLDALYWSAGLLDLWNLMLADYLISYNWRLQRCAVYLSDTACDFNNAEHNILNNI